MTIATGQQILASDVLGLRFTEIWSATTNVGTNTNTWIDWDLSAIVPSGTKVVIVTIQLGPVTGYRGARKNGSTDSRTYSIRYDRDQVVVTLLCECDSNRVIEIYSCTDTDTFRIIGYQK